MSNGDDLLHTFANLNINLRNLSPNVIKAWFDTDCENTKNLLNWLCVSLSSVNYMSPLERTEFNNIEEPLDSNRCTEELAKLNPDYLSILEDDKTLEEIQLIEDEIDLLEEESKDLDKLIKIYENVDNSLSSELTSKTLIEIQSKVEDKKSQEACEHLCRNLDEFNKKLQKTLVKYDPDSHIVNFVNVKEYYEHIETLKPLVLVDKSFLDRSDEQFSEDLETCRKRILHSQQIYLANKVETEKLKEVLEFLNRANEDKDILRWNTLNSNANQEEKEQYKKKMCGVLDGIAAKIANHHLKLTRIHYVEQELKEVQQKSQNISELLDNLIKCLSYYAITNCLQLEEKKNVECINDFYQKMVKYVDEDLYRCRARTEQMKTIIEEYRSYLSSPPYEKSKLVSSIVKILSSDAHDFKSAADAVGKFRTELSLLDSEFFCVNLEKEKERTNFINENIKTLQKFLISGPTDRVVLIPLELQKVWLEIEEHLKKESDSVGQAVQIPQSVRKATTKSQDYTRQLWMNFLANPSRIISILSQAEEDFKKRTQQYF